MGMAVLAMFLSYGTLEPGAMVLQQGPWPWQWGIVRGVPHFIAFFLFLTAAFAEPSARPLTCPRANPRSWATSSSIRACAFGMFYSGRVSRSDQFVGAHGDHFPGRLADFWGASVLPQLGPCSFVDAGVGGKVFLFCFFQLLVRCDPAAFRADQLMRLGWQRLLPLSIANVVLAACWQMWVH